MEKPRYFQYLAGDRRNEIVVLDQIVQEDGLVFCEFKDASRCNQEFIVPLNDRNWNGKLMAEISSPTNGWNFKTEWIGKQEEKWATNAEGKEVCIQPLVEGKKRILPVFPQNIVRDISVFGQVNKVIQSPTPAPIITKKEEIKKKFEGDPVWAMCDAAKKFPTSISLEMEINILKKSLFLVADESFNNGGEKVVEYIIENLDILAIRDSLKQALYQSYGYIKELEESVIEEPIIDEPVIEEPIIDEFITSKENLK